MSSRPNAIEEFTSSEYKHGFVTDIEQESFPKGLSEETVRLISAKKNEPEFLLEWRLKAYRQWLTMKEPAWANVHYPPIDYQEIVYYSAPKAPKTAPEEPGRGRSRAAAKPTRSSAFRCEEQEMLAGVAVDAVFDSVSVATTFKEKLGEARHHLLLVLRGGARITRIWSGSTSARSFRTATTTSRP